MGHPNLSPGLNAILAAGDDPKVSVNLSEARVGQRMVIVLEGKFGQRTIEVQVEKPTGADAFKDHAQVKVLSSEHQELKAGSSIEIWGSCTVNPGAPLGMTMFHAGTMTAGRNPVLALAGEESGFFLRFETYKRIYVLP